MKRIILDFPENTMLGIDKLQHIMGIKSKRELIGLSLGLLKTVADNIKDGSTLQLKKGDKTVEVVLPLF